MTLGTGGEVDELAEEAAGDPPHLAVAAAGGAARELRARLGAIAAAAGTAFVASDFDLLLAAEGCLLKVDLDVNAAVGAPLALTGAAAGGAAEEGVEDVAEATKVEPLERPSEVEALEPRVAVAVVGGALLRVGEDLIRLADLLELGLSPVLFVAIRVIPHRQLPERFLDLLCGGVPGHTQDFVVVAFRSAGHIQSIVSEEG